MAAGPALEALLVDVAGSTVVVDLRHLSFIDSSGVGALLRARRRTAEAGDRLVLRGPLQPTVGQVIEILGLSYLLEE